MEKFEIANIGGYCAEMCKAKRESFAADALMQRVQPQLRV